jgi:Alpha/beta hydrolase domain
VAPKALWSSWGVTALVIGPVTIGYPVGPISPIRVALAEHGYTEEEFFVSGSASSYEASGELGADGLWRVRPCSSASYATRMLVRRPAEPSRFSGTVVVEWLNVSGGVEAAPDWAHLHPWLLAEGCVYVAVSVQALGVDGGRALIEHPGLQMSPGLVGTAPERYGQLHHPGDAYAYDIFSQVGSVLRGGGEAPVLGELRPEQVIAIGESQSAFFLTSYANAVHPTAEVYDGFFIHSRGGGGASLSGEPRGGASVPDGLRIRNDLDVPVFVFETETELSPRFGFAPARQPDADRLRIWEVAGTAHADAYLVGKSLEFLGWGFRVNEGPQRFVARAALAALDRWMRGGPAPPRAAPLELLMTDPPTIARDEDGIALGGVRTPDVDVPALVLSGEAPAGANPMCELFGSTVPLAPGALRARYGDPKAYLASYERDLDRTITAGFLLDVDRSEMRARALAMAWH